MDGTVKYRNKETLIDRSSLRKANSFSPKDLIAYSVHAIYSGILSAPDLLHGKPLDAVYLKPLRLGKISFISCFFTYLFVFLWI